MFVCDPDASQICSSEINHMRESYAEEQAVWGAGPVDGISSTQTRTLLSEAVPSLWTGVIEKDIFAYIVKRLKIYNLIYNS